MNTPTQAIGNDLKSLGDHTRDLVTAGAEAAGEKLSDARKGLSSALESGKEMAVDAGEKAMRGVKSACDSAKTHPLQAVAIAVGLTALVVIATRLLSHRNH